MGRKRNQAYSEEFRKEAVKRSEQPGVTQAEVAKELGLSSQKIANWKVSVNSFSHFFLGGSPVLGHATEWMAS